MLISDECPDDKGCTDMKKASGIPHIDSVDQGENDMKDFFDPEAH